MGTFAATLDLANDHAELMKSMNGTVH